MTNPTPIALQRGKPFAPPRSQTLRAAAILDLLDREDLLMAQLRFIGESSHLRRVEIEAELSRVRRDLGRLGFTPGGTREMISRSRRRKTSLASQTVSASERALPT
jgi:hypothetical protein